MINVALFGFGRIGQMHAENLTKNKEIKLLYVYEKIDQLSNKAKKLYGCKIEKNYNKIFNDKKVDIVFISSPTNTHIKFIEEGMKRKKTIFCEKPLDLNINKIIKRIRDLREEMASAGVPTNNASSGNIAGLPPDSPPVKQKKRYIYSGRGSRKMWLTNKKNG